MNKYPLGRSSSLLQWCILGCFLLALIGYNSSVIYTEYWHIDRQERERLGDQAKIIQENFEKQLLAANAVLVHILYQMPLWNIRLDGQNLAIQVLNILSDAMPAIRTLWILNADETVFASSRGELKGKSLKERTYFQSAMRLHERSTLYVSEPSRTALGSPTIDLARAMVRPNNEFAGIVAATLEPEAIKVLLNSVRYSPEISVVLFNSQGSIFLCSPESLSSIGGPEPLFLRYRAAHQSNLVITGTSQLNGEESFAAFRTIQPGELRMNQVLAVGVIRPIRPVFSTWQDRLYEQVLSLSLLTLISLLSLLIIQRYQRQQEKMYVQFERFFQIIPDLACIVSVDGYFYRINKAWFRTLGYTEQELLSVPMMSFIHPNDQERTQDEWTHLILGNRSRYFVNRYRCKNGDYRWLEWQAVLSKDDRLVFACAHDITLLQVQNDQLNNLAYCDALTGIPNRRLLVDRINQAIIQARRSTRNFAVCYLDLDGFKPINDQYGHATGDRVIIAIVERLKMILRDGDVLARLGGDEFVLLLAGFDDPVDQIRPILDRVLATIRTPLPLDHQVVVCVSASIGVAFYPGDNTDSEGLIDHADRMMYLAKQAGKNRYCCSP